jgi:hypothetical protein
VLEGDGFQGRKFGDPAEEVIAALTRLFGPPTEDRSDVAAGQSPFGVCPGTTARTVRWGPVSVLLTDESGASRFSGWAVDGGEARTPAGIRVGSTVSDVRAAYPQATLETEPLGDRFVLEAGNRFVVGGLTGVADTDLVEYLTNHPCGELLYGPVTEPAGCCASGATIGCVAKDFVPSRTCGGIGSS